MKLKPVDKATYKEHRSRIQWIMIAFLFALSLGFAELYQALLGNGEPNLMLNALGVATGAGLVTFGLYRLRETPYFEEVYYVWKLKQELNRIYRKQKLVDAAVSAGSREGLIIRLYHYEASRQVYDLDDNTLTMSDLIRDLDAMREQIAESGLTISVDDYHPDLLQGLAAKAS